MTKQWALAQEKIQIRHDLPPLLFWILCGSLLFVDDPFSVGFPELFVFPSHVALRQIFALLLMPFLVLFCVTLAVFKPFLATFLTFFRVFLGSLDAFYSSLSLVALSLSFQPIFTQTPFSTNLNNKNFLRLTKLQLCRYCCFES